MSAKTKRILALFLSLVMLLSLFPATVFAEGDAEPADDPVGAIHESPEVDPAEAPDDPEPVDDPVGAEAPGGPEYEAQNEAQDIPIDEGHFPDTNFRAYVAENLDPDHDGLLTDAERAVVTEIDVCGHWDEPGVIESLSGIEYFPALTRLDCDYNQLAELDLSSNPALEQLYCNDNQLTALNLNANTALKTLDCHRNQLTALDLSGNPALAVLWCYGNQLTALNLSHNPELVTAHLEWNELTALDLSVNTALTVLYCNYNQLTALNLSANRDLEELYCNDNKLTALDLSSNSALKELYCGNNQLKALDLCVNIALTVLSCYDNQLKSLDLSANPALTRLTCYGNAIAELDLRPCPTLLEAARGESRVPSWNSDVLLYGGSEIFPDDIYTLAVDATTRLIIGDEPQTEGIPIDEAHFPDVHFRAYVAENLDPDHDGLLTDAEREAVTEINCSDQSIADLSGIKHFPALWVLYCDNNQLTALDLSANPALTVLICFNNELTALDVSANPVLEELDCCFNQLKALDLSGNPALEQLDCSNNRLTALDLSVNTVLTWLGCYSNQLTALDLSANPALRYLYCHDNQLTALELRANSALLKLRCDSNQLTALDLSGNPALDRLWCYRNQIAELDLRPCPTLLEAARGESRVPSWNSDVLIYGGEGDSGYTLAVDATTRLITGDEPQSEGIPIDEEHFPDASFRAYVAENLDPDHDGLLTDAEREAVTFITCSNQGIADLSGIEYFPALEVLHCDNNRFTTLDLSANTALTRLDCRNSQLTALNLSSNPALTWLYCNYNQLTVLDLSGAPALEELHCDYNELTALDVSSNPAITTLDCYGNQIAELDISNNSSLIYLHCFNNQLTALDLSANPALRYLDCHDNRLTALDLSTTPALRSLGCWDNQIAELDLSPCETLLEAARGESRIPSWNSGVRLYGGEDYDYGYSYILGVDATTRLIIGDEPQTEGIPIDEAHFPDVHFRAYVAENLDPDHDGLLTDAEREAVTEIDCSNQGIADLSGIEYFPALTTLCCYSNELTALDLSANPALWVLYCDNNQLTALDLSANPALEQLYCYGNQLTALDVSANPVLEELDCCFNQLTALDLSANAKLTHLECYRNQIAELDLRPCPTLLEAAKGECRTASWDYGVCLYGGWNNYNYTLAVDATTRLITGDEPQSEGIPIDEEHFPDTNFRAYVAENLDPDHDGLLTDAEREAVTEIDCSDQSIADLSGIKHFPALTTLYCYSNELTALDLSANPALTVLICFNNELTALDVSANPVLEELDCCFNQLKALDLSGNPALDRLWCYRNRIAELDLQDCPILVEATRGESRVNASGDVVFYGPYEEVGNYHLAVDASTRLITGDEPENTDRIYGSNRFATSEKTADALLEVLGVEQFDAVVVAYGLGFADALGGSYLAIRKDAPILVVDDAHVDSVHEKINEVLAPGGAIYLLGGTGVVNQRLENELNSDPKGYSVKRLAGANRYDTNLAILREVGVAPGDPILVCDATGYADSLSASASGLPILLVGKNGLTAEQQAWLTELKAQNGELSFIMIGGEGAVTPAIEAACAEYGTTDRIGGANRFATSRMVAEELVQDPEAIVLGYGLNFPDGLCGASLAYNLHAPLILATSTRYQDAAAYAQAHGLDKVVTLGGPGLISDEAIRCIVG